MLSASKRGIKRRLEFDVLHQPIFVAVREVLFPTMRRTPEREQAKFIQNITNSDCFPSLQKAASKNVLREQIRFILPLPNVHFHSRQFYLNSTGVLGIESVSIALTDTVVVAASILSNIGAVGFVPALRVHRASQALGNVVL